MLPLVFYFSVNLANSPFPAPLHLFWSCVTFPKGLKSMDLANERTTNDPIILEPL